MKSILQSNQECLLCKKTEPLHIHHVFNGPNRKHSESFGLKVYLCNKCHERVHTDQELDESLKRLGQSKYELLYGHELFMKTFRKNYL